MSLSTEQNQHIMTAAKDATHFRPSNGHAWYTIQEVMQSIDATTISVKVIEHVDHSYFITGHNYNAVEFEKRIPIKLPFHHRLSPLVDNLNKALIWINELMELGKDGLVVNKEAFKVSSETSLKALSLTGFCASHTRHDWLMEVGCSPIVAALACHLDNTMIHAFGTYADNQGTYQLSNEEGHWKYLIHSIELLVAALNEVIEQTTLNQE